MGSMPSMQQATVQLSGCVLAHSGYMDTPVHPRPLSALPTSRCMERQFNLPMAAQSIG